MSSHPYRHHKTTNGVNFLLKKCWKKRSYFSHHHFTNPLRGAHLSLSAGYYALPAPITQIPQRSVNVGCQIVRFNAIVAMRRALGAHVWVSLGTQSTLGTFIDPCPREQLSLTACHVTLVTKGMFDIQCQD